MDYQKYISSLRKAADYFGKMHPEFPEVAETYRKCAEIIEALIPTPNTPLTPADLQGMSGEPYWHVGLRDESKPPHWEILPEFAAKYPQDYFYGKYWLAYRRKLEEKP